jgi:hypothetical protein
LQSDGILQPVNRIGTFFLAILVALTLGAHVPGICASSCAGDRIHASRPGTKGCDGESRDSVPISACCNPTACAANAQCAPRFDPAASNSTSWPINPVSLVPARVGLLADWTSSLRVPHQGAPPRAGVALFLRFRTLQI